MHRRWPERLWDWYSHLSGLVVMSLAIALIVVFTFADGGGAVWEGSNLVVHTSKVHVGERLSFTLDLKANESCPGEFVSVMTSLTNSGPPATVTFRRPVTRPGISVDDATAYVELPESVSPGRWQFIHSVESRCVKRVRLDELARFNIEVLP